MRQISITDICLMVVFTILCIACFPANPLVLTGVIETNFYLAPFVSGCIFWAIGMVLVMAPIVQFPRRGGVPGGKSFVHTTRLVDTGIYAVVRHPQYLGGILALFLTTLLWYPHWLFAVLGIPGAIFCYWSAVEEERNLTKRFGNDYLVYMERVPRMNLISGVIRLLRQGRNPQG